MLGDSMMGPGTATTGARGIAKKAAALTAAAPAEPNALTGVSGGDDALNTVGNPAAGIDTVNIAQCAKAADVSAALNDLGRKCNQLRTYAIEIETRLSDLEAKLQSAGVLT